MSARKDFRSREEKPGGERSAHFSSQGVKLLERDPGREHPIWTQGPASAFVVAKMFMETRAKSDGVHDLWIGKETTNFNCTTSAICIHYDPTYDEPFVKIDSPEGAELMDECKATP
jgi:hypothetical protein